MKVIIKSIINIVIRFFNIKKELIILDDLFPHYISVFRNMEFQSYLKQYDTVIYSTGNALKIVNETKSIDSLISEYKILFPEYKKKIKKFNPNKIIKSKLCYFIFLHNAYLFLSYVHKNKIPFIFTLYPGGNFILNDYQSDSWLKEVLGSPFFRGVIVTQKITYEYLVEKKLCNIDKICFIYGAVMSNSYSENIKIDKKINYNICFVANKYSLHGEDKGYDVFIETAKLLIKTNNHFLFHVVGNFTTTTINIDEIKSNIIFYGNLQINKLKKLYEDQDIILSPNRSNILAKGAFDGFPLAASIEASLCNVAMFVSDDINQNIYYKNKEDIVIIDHNPKNISNTIIEYYNNKELLIRIANNGRIKSTSLFSNEFQINERIKFINKIIKK